MRIGNFEIGSSRTFVIAEIGNNHNGDISVAKSLIDSAIGAGADCVKFQMRKMQSLYRESSLSKSGDDLGTEYILDLLERFELSTDEHRELYDYCAERNVQYMCTPWEKESLSVLESFGVVAYKVASADLTNIPLIGSICDTGKPLILSTGMSTVAEVSETVKYLNSRDADFALLHCNSTYPAPLHDINLKWMRSLKKLHPIVGYSGHERGTAVSIAAVALGAKIIERHFTFDRGWEGPDHAASLTPEEFERMVSGIREVEAALGKESRREVSQGELINRENLAKSLVASRALPAGTVVTDKDVKVLSPGQGLSPQRISDLIGVKLQRDVEHEGYFFESDISGNLDAIGTYSFSRPWGVPVRYHDFADYVGKTNLDLVEFHLSYSDLDLDEANYLKDTYDIDFVVHAPELFSESRLMDLASEDESYRQFSIKETQRVVDLTRRLKTYFPSTKNPVIVANVGGFTMDAPVDEHTRRNFYQLLNDSLSSLDLDGVALTPQTMAPFPWHFGGQRYQNIFIKKDEIKAWCESTNMGICLDVSHSMLAANHFGFDFYDFCEGVAEFCFHLHLGDARGVNGEGLQIGEGEIDFDRLMEIFDKKCPTASFIPEIWQGHKNGGEGFWTALKLLSNQGKKL